MSNNQYGYKQRVAPNDYLNGPVRVFTSLEIQEWEANKDPRIDAKLNAQAGLDEEQIKFLDTLSLVQAEDTFSEVMEGVSPNEQS